MSAIGDLEGTTCRRLGLLLIAIGLASAAGSYLGFPVVYKLWPLLTLSLGIGFIGVFARRRARGALFLAFGEYLILFSGLALYFNFTSWRNLKDLWPVLVGFLGVVFATLLIFNRESRFLRFVAVLFVLLSASLFIMHYFGSEYWWSVPVLAGLSVLVSGRRE